MNLKSAESKLMERIDDIDSFAKTGSPLVFVLASAFLDYLAKLSQGKNNHAEGYKKFINDWMSKIRPAYLTFQYKCGKHDLSVQMYHVLRCGILHSFSLIPDKQSRSKEGRDRSIVLMHRKEAKEKSYEHLDRYVSTSVPDAALFIAEDFVEDIAQVTKRIFDDAAKDLQLEMKMKDWLSQFPFITGD